jgi:hypothetical protein
MKPGEGQGSEFSIFSIRNIVNNQEAAYAR